MKEYNRQYELNNNGEVDNGVLINSKTQSSINMSDRSSESNTKNDIFDLNILNEKDEIDDFKLIKEEKKNNKNNNKRNKAALQSNKAAFYYIHSELSYYSTIISDKNIKKVLTFSL